ncbi:MAG: hypothetical protein LAP85_00215 [Acidobacteriia bacterium]|nr:hypothetical protein [Terriglobia bacterium]
MMPDAGSVSLIPKAAVLLALFSMGFLFAQAPQSTQFYDVQISKDEIYSYTNLKFAGDFTRFESARGFLALGRTEAGVTIVMVLGEGTANIEAPETVQDKFKTVFGAYPLKTTFKTLYMRLHPKEYEEVFGKQTLTKAADEATFTAAKQLFDERFIASYHAGPKAMLPPYRTRVIELNTADLGLVWTEEGYWLTLRRYAPYASIYPRDFVNPKQK